MTLTRPPDAASREPIRSEATAAQPDVAQLSGIVAILPTPLDESGAIDDAGIRHLVHFCAEQGFDGAVALGSNGEFPYLTFEEKCRVMQVAAEAGRGRLAVIGTASAPGTEEAIALAHAARSAGCDAVMAPGPLPGRRTSPTHALLKEALRLAGHPISNMVRRPYEAVGEPEIALVRTVLERLGLQPGHPSGRKRP
jgi:dihydrodipicolinate synthase/N-acetylneuraminate lyase